MPLYSQAVTRDRMLRGALKMCNSCKFIKQEIVLQMPSVEIGFWERALHIYNYKYVYI